MTHKLFAPFLILALGLVASGNTDLVQAQAKKSLRIAMLAPRGSIVHREFKRMDQKLEQITNGTWTMKVYPSGTAGDDTDVIRKMRVGQMDGGVITTVGLSHIVRSLAVLDAPGVINSYKELEAVQKDMRDEWDTLFLKADTKLLSMWEAGRYRLFSKGPVRNLDELRKHRAWLWPDSQVMKEMWRTMGVTGVPLGITDVFGALQTGMIDVVVNTPVALVALRWHLNLDHVSQREAGVLLLSWVLNKKAWDSVPEVAQKEIEKQLAATGDRYKADARREDAKAYQTLLKRGYTATTLSAANEKEWVAAEGRVCKRLAGRVYSAATLARIKSVTSKVK